MLTDFLSFLKISLIEFKRHFWQYLMLFLGMQLFLLFILIPIFNFLASNIIRIAGIHYVSYTNLLALIGSHPLGMLVLLLLLCLLLISVCFQFAFQFQGLYLIFKGEVRFRRILIRSFASLKSLNPKSFLFFVFYFVVIFPFGQYIFSSPLLAKLQIPAFSMAFFYQDAKHLSILIFFYILILIFASLFIFVIPELILLQKTLKQALKSSLAYFKSIGKFFKLLLYFILIIALSFFVTQAIYWPLYYLQVLLDSTPLAFASASLLMLVIELLKFVSLALTSMLLFSLLLNEMEIKPLKNPPQHPPIAKIWLNFWRILAVLTLAGLLLVNGLYMSGLTTNVPLTISHRGVNKQNGVQNTIPALINTAKLDPDYVEMDVQETADHQFVVMHDKNLRLLTGHNKNVEDLTLSELTRLTVREHGKSAKIPSFDDYLATANRKKQKLLIEIKSNPKDSSNITQLFLNKYSQNIKQHHHILHSADFPIMEELKSREPHLFVSFILPFNVIFPNSKADGYTMEATTLNARFVDEAHRRGLKVFAWTVDDAPTMDAMIYNNVDGIITDNLSLLKQQLRQSVDKPSYAERLRFFFNLSPLPVDQTDN